MGHSNRCNFSIEETLVPVIVGVTGHRDVREEDVDCLRKVALTVLSEIKGLCPNSPLVLLSALADGADRLVAKEALSMGFDLIVPCPMYIEEYKKDFSKASLLEFEELLQRAQNYIEMPLINGNTPENITDQSNRGLQYKEMGAYIANHSQILIALWDGRIINKRGGTSGIVELKLRGKHDFSDGRYDPLSPPDSGPVYQIVTPRRSSPVTEGTPFTIHKHFPGIHGELVEADKAEAAYNLVLKRINRFNTDMEYFIRRHNAAVDKSRSYIFSPDEVSRLKSEVKSIFNVYSLADSLACYFQKRNFWIERCLFLLAVIAVFFFEIYAHILTQQKILAAYPAVILLGAFLYYMAKIKGINDRYIDYRALAEGLRVQMFWDICRIGENASDYYLRRQRTEIEWIRNVINSQQLQAIRNRVSKACNNSSDNYSELVINNWIKDQMNFFGKKSLNHNARYERLEKGVNFFFFGGILAAVITFIWKLYYPEMDEGIHLAAVITMGLAPAIAAALGGYSGKMAFSEHKGRYKRMTYVYTKALNFIQENSSCMNKGEFDKIIFELGKEALSENGDWVILHREKPMSLPKG